MYRADRPCPVCGEPLIGITRSTRPYGLPSGAEFFHDRRRSGWRRGPCKMLFHKRQLPSGRFIVARIERFYAQSK